MVDYCGKTIGILFLNVWSVKPSKNQQGSKNVYNYGRIVAYEPNYLYKSMTYTTLLTMVIGFARCSDVGNTYSPNCDNKVRYIG